MLKSYDWIEPAYMDEGESKQCVINNTGSYCETVRMTSQIYTGTLAWIRLRRLLSGQVTDLYVFSDAWWCFMGRHRPNTSSFRYQSPWRWNSCGCSYSCFQLLLRTCEHTLSVIINCHLIQSEVWGSLCDSVLRLRTGRQPKMRPNSSFLQPPTHHHHIGGPVLHVNHVIQRMRFYFCL